MLRQKWLKLIRRRELLALITAIFTSGLAPTAMAEPGKCVLRVDGHTYLNGPCEISLEGGGDFEISSPSEVRPYYFAGSFEF